MEALDNVPRHSTFVLCCNKIVGIHDNMIIYDSSGNKIIDAPINKEAIIKFVLMGDYYIQLPFSLRTPLEFARGHYVLYRGRRFEIMSNVRPDFDTKTGGYKYVLQFQAQQNHMKRFICFWLGDANPEAVFHNTTDLASFGALIVANMNKALGTDNWKLGTINNIEHPESTKLVSFNGDTCWDSLNTVAETFETEWWTEENNGIVSLHFGKLEFGSPEVFQRGKVVQAIPAKKGDDSEYGTRFYVFGSTRNLTKEYGQAAQGGATNHVSEIRLRLPNGQQYINAKPNLLESEVVEKVVFFDDIYPKNTETINIVRSTESEVIEGQKDPIYNIVSLNTPFRPIHLIEGQKLGVHFTSGSLTGREFELGIGDIDTWTPQYGFDIVPDVETAGDSNLIIPNASLKPEPGDTFVLTGVKLPQQRIEEAEQELLTSGTSYAIQHSNDTDVYDCPTNPVYCTLNDKNYEAGQSVLLVGPQFGNEGRLSRIQGYEKKLYNEYIATYTVGDNTPYSRLGSIEADVKATLYSQRIGVTETGAQIYLISRYDTTQPTDSNAYSARRTMWEFANKQTADSFHGKMTFKDGAQYGSYAPGITGIGGLIDKNGVAELESLSVRRFLEVPELRYNRVEITMGDTWYASSAGIIESVDTENHIITLKLEDGEIGNVRPGDICMGIFHSLVASNNATEDYDDSRGNRRFAGFATCYFQIGEILDATCYSKFTYQLRPISDNYPKQFSPAASMNFVGYGSFTDPARRTSRYETRTYQRYLKEVSNWEFTADNIAAQFGDLTNLSVHGLSMKGYSAYLENVYMQGMLRSTDGTFVLDTRTKSLLMASSETGMGIAFNPAAGWKMGKTYDPATGHFVYEYDIEKIDKELAEVNEAVSHAEFRNLIRNSGTQTIPIGSTDYNFVSLPLTLDVSAGEDLALSVGGIMVLAGAPTKFTAALYALEPGGDITTGVATLTPDQRTFVFRIKEGVVRQKARLLLYAGEWGHTAGCSVRYNQVMLVRGNRPALTWTEAPEDSLARIQAAQDTASEALQTAAWAHAQLETWGSDNYISPQEKTSLRQMEKDMESEYADVTAQARKYAVSTDPYRAAYEAAAAAFRKYTAPSPQDILKEADYADIVSYYTRRQQILESIHTAIKTGVETAQQDATTAQSAAQAAEQTANAAQQTADEAARRAQAAQDYIDNTLPSELAEVNRKLDGVVENWYFPYTPTLFNAPASAWITTQEKAAHEGDTFTNIQEYVDAATTPDAGKAWRWVKDGSIYKWTPIADSDAVKALTEAYKAQQTAEEKSRTFVVQPLPPYSVGDLWAPGEMGELKRCIKTRASGSYTAEDWVPAADYYKYVNQQIEEIEVGDNILNGSHVKYVEAKNSLPRLTLSTSEMRGKVLTSRVTLKGEAVQADHLGYEIYIHFIDGSEQWIAHYTPANIPDRGTFEKTYQFSNQVQDKEIEYAYLYPIFRPTGSNTASGRLYIRQEFVGIGTKIPSTWSPSVVDVQGQIDGIQFSAANLLPGSDEITVGVSSNAYNFASVEITVEVTAGEDLALSVGGIMVLSGAPTKFTAALYALEPGGDITTGVATLTPDQRTFVFRIKEGVVRQKARLLLYAGEWGHTAGCSVRYNQVMLVRGNRPALTWTEAPEEVQEQIDKVSVGVKTLDYLKDAFRNDESIEYYGISINSFLGVKNMENNIVAFLTGKDISQTPPANFMDGTSCPILATGVPVSNESLSERANKASFRVYPTGDVYANRFIAEGKCEFRDGCKIGPFTIEPKAVGMNYSNNYGGIEQAVTLGTDRISIRESSKTAGAYASMGWWYGSVEDDIVGLNISSTSDSTIGKNYGAVKLSVSDGHCALGIENGVIKGLRPQVRKLSKSTTLTPYDHTILCDTTSTDIDLLLPGGPRTGQEYEIYKLTSGHSLRILANGHPIRYALNTTNETSTLSSYAITTIYSMVKVVYLDGSWHLFELKNAKA